MPVLGSLIAGTLSCCEVPFWNALPALACIQDVLHRVQSAPFSLSGQGIKADKASIARVLKSGDSVGVFPGAAAANQNLVAGFECLLE